MGRARRRACKLPPRGEAQSPQGRNGLGHALGSKFAKGMHRVHVALLGGARVPQNSGARVSRHTQALVEEHAHIACCAFTSPSGQPPAATVA